MTSRPAYQHGFIDGLRDGVEVLASMSNAGRGWRRSPETMRGDEWRAPPLPYASEGNKAGGSAEGSPENDGAYPVDTLRDELRAYHRLLRQGSTHSELRAPIEQLRALIRNLGRRWCGSH